MLSFILEHLSLFLFVLQIESLFLFVFISTSEEHNESLFSLWTSDVETFNFHYYYIIQLIFWQGFYYLFLMLKYIITICFWQEFKKYKKPFITASENWRAGRDSNPRSSP